MTLSPMRSVALISTALVVVGCAPSDSPSAKPHGSSDDASDRSPHVVLHPSLAVADEDYYLSKNWSVRLPGNLRKRVEDDNLIFWRHGMTVYAVVWGNDKNESASGRLSWMKQQMSSDAFDAQEARDGEILRFTYRLTENRKEGVVHALYGYAIGQSGHVQMAIYVDRESEIDSARKILQSVTEHARRASGESSRVDRTR